MSGGRDAEYSSGVGSDYSSNEGRGSRSPSHEEFRGVSIERSGHGSDNSSREGRSPPPAELRGVSINHEASNETISTLNSVAEIVIEAPPAPPHIQ